ncbi:MAG: hypothetical protein KBD64_07100 [Gammaproteobacteria bacterium]|nr:hypothetical protein [Gammaproteobacteria bacterium]
MLKNLVSYFALVYFVFNAPISFAEELTKNAANSTKRIPQFVNKKVAVWETIIAPGKNKILKMHRHDKDRVIVALGEGLLKVTNDKGEIHFLKLEKNKAYFLEKDVPNELHNDQNMTTNPIRVLVIELQ